MPTLREHLLGDDRKRLVTQTVGLIDQEMAAKSGLRALAFRAAYKLVKGFKPGFMPGVVNSMLPEFCDALEPFFQEWVGEGPSRGGLDGKLIKEQAKVSESLLAVADRRVNNAGMKGAAVLQKVYRKLRPGAKNHVVTALPGLARTVRPFLPQ